MPRQHCSNLADIAQEKSWANIKQKNKIVQNNDIVLLNLINFFIKSRLFLFLMFLYHLSIIFTISHSIYVALSQYL